MTSGMSMLVNSRTPNRRRFVATGDPTLGTAGGGGEPGTLWPGLGRDHGGENRPDGAAPGRVLVGAAIGSVSFNPAMWG